MAKKLRSVNTHFWDDVFIRKLSPAEKLLFLYLLTNSLTNVLGIYEITLERMIFDTGLDEKTVLKALKHFESFNKVFHIDNFIILANFLKNQSMNSNMKIGAIAVFNDLPLNITELSNYEGNIEDFESLLKALESFENSNINIKFNSNGNSNTKNVNPSFDEVEQYGKENGYDLPVQKIINHYTNGGKFDNWINSKGKDVKLWRRTLSNNWFEAEYKIKPPIPKAKFPEIIISNE